MALRDSYLYSTSLHLQCLKTAQAQDVNERNQWGQCMAQQKPLPPELAFHAGTDFSCPTSNQFPNTLEEAVEGTSSAWGPVTMLEN